MVNPQELRIGNLVLDSNGNIRTIAGINSDGIDMICLHCERATFQELVPNVFPILLSEDWFLKLGFIKEDNKIHDGNFYSRHYMDSKYCFAYAPFREDWGFYLEYTDSPYEEDENKKYPISYGLKYVHQLQNLYYLISEGEELTLKTRI